MSSQAKIVLILTKKPYSLMSCCFLHVTNVGKKWSRVTEFHLLGFFGREGFSGPRTWGGEVVTPHIYNKKIAMGEEQNVPKSKEMCQKSFLASLSVSLNKGEVVSLFYGCRKIACVLSFCRKFAG